MTESEESVETIEERTSQIGDFEISPFSNSTINIEDKKRERIERYRNCTYPLNEDLFYELRGRKLLSIVPEFLNENVNNGTSKAYRNCFVWNLEGLSNLPISDEIGKQEIISYLTQSEGITNTQREELLSRNPNTLVSAMTILSNNYEWCIGDLISIAQEKSYLDTYNQTVSPNIMLTEQELTSFLLGRTMLIELNKVNKSEYIKELIRGIDGIICMAHQGLIKKFARNRNRGEYFQELIQEGNLGVLRALQTYDIDRGLRFSTYVTPWIRQKQGRFLVDNSRLVRFPSHIQTSINNFNKAQEQLERQNSHQPDTKQVYDFCEEKGIRISATQKLMQELFLLRQVGSLNDPLSDDEGSTLMDIIPEKGATQDDLVFITSIDDIFSKAHLDEREVRILKLRWGFIHSEALDKTEHTLGEIGDIMGITRERARQLEKRAILKLQEFAEKW